MQSDESLLARPAFQQAARNFAWLLGERGIRFALGAGVGFLIARQLGPTLLGSLSYGVAVVTLFQSFAGAGIDAVVRRDLLQTPEHTHRLLADSVGLRVLGGLVAGLAMVVYLYFVPVRSADERMVLIVLSLLLLQPAWTVPELWLQAHLHARQAVLAQTVALAVAAAVRLWLLATGGGLPAFAAAIVLENLLAGVALHFAARRAGLRINWWPVPGPVMRRLAVESAPLWITSMAIIVYMRIDEIMLRHLSGPAEVGIYAAATKLSEIWYFVPVALGSSLLPALIRARNAGPDAYHDRLQRYFDVSAAAAYGLAIPVAVLAPWLIRLAYGEAYAASAPVLAIHIWASLFVFSGVARGQWLVNEGHTHFYLYATVAGAVSNIVLNLYFIPRWGAAGAAWATLLAYGVAAWLSSFATAPTRAVAWMQTRALLLPLLGWRYLRS